MSEPESSSDLSASRSLVRGDHAVTRRRPTGDQVMPLVSPDGVLELGIRSARASRRAIVFEVNGNAEEVLGRLVGGELAKCPSFRPFEGRAPRIHYVRHDFEAHADLWRQGLRLVDLEAIKERSKQADLANASGGTDR